MKRYLFFIAFGLVFISELSYSQLNLNFANTNRPSLRWKQIQTEYFQVIFPEGFESEGKRIANTLDFIYHPVSKTLDVKPRKYPVILQNRNSVSNGFVTFGPRRSEFFTVPSQDYNSFGTNDWLEHLAVHEYRHIVQFEKSLTGFNKGIYYLLGENGAGAYAFLKAPLWYWEGDAVGVETAFSHSGRGRIPEFNINFRTNLLEEKPYSFDKQYLNSFKDFVPDIRVLGYYLTTHIKNENEVGVWGEIHQNVMGNPISTFNSSVKKETRKNLKQNYQDMLSEVTAQWEDQKQSLNITQSQKQDHESNKAFTDYRFPHQLSNGDWVALKSGLGDFPQFVRVDENGKEKRVFTPGFINSSGMLSYVDDKVVWNEFGFHERWRIETYSVIKTFDFKTRKVKNLTNKSRYFSAAFSPDASKIVTLHISNDNEHKLHILNAENGTVLDILDNPGNPFLINPVWSGDTSIIAIRLTNEGKSFVEFDIQNGTVKELTEPTDENFGHPVIKGKYILYNASRNDIDEIFALDRVSGEKYLVITKEYGAFNPSISQTGDSIFFNNYELEGLKVEKISFRPENWTLVDDTRYRIDFQDQIVEQEGHPDILQNIPSNDYPIKDFRKVSNLFKVHSWGPSVIATNLGFSLGIQSDNLLSSSSLAAGYRFNQNELSGQFFGSFTYSGLYPVLSTSYSYGIRQTTENIEGEGNTDFDWTESSVGFNVSVPLVLTDNRFIETLTISTGINYTFVEDFDIPEANRDFDQIGNGEVLSHIYQIGYNRFHRRAIKDLASRWGQSILIRYQHTPYDLDFESELVGVEGRLFVPGLFKHHTTQLRLNYQYQDLGNFRFSSPVQFARGYGYFSDLEHYYSVGLTYGLPIAYPDLALGSILNIQRISLFPFYDYSEGFNSLRVESVDRENFNSLGAELRFDFNIFRLLPLINLGVRYSRLTSFSDNRFQLIIGTIGL
ncbi:MAG: hypothetical protein AAF363_21315 [Bacteroidota bacterium]